MDTIPQNIPLKQCKSCKEFKYATTEHFNVAKSNVDGLHTMCRDCRKASRRTRPQPEVLPSGYKRCFKCREIKQATVEYFYPHNKQGLQAYCKVCACEVALSNYNRTKSQLPKSILPECIKCIKCGEDKPATEEYFQKNPVSKHGLYNVCKVCRHEQAQQNHINNPEKRPRQGKVYRMTHKQHLRMKQRRYLSTEHGRALYRVNVRNRDARKRNAPGFHTAEDIQKQYERQKGRCYWCGQKLTKYHVDHITPLTRGGSNWPDNLVLACPHCNISRNNRLPHEWPEGGRLL